MNLPEKNLDTPFNITRTSHVVLTVKDLEASRLFYTEVVGLMVTEQIGGTLYLRGVEEACHHSLVLKQSKDAPRCERIGMRVLRERDLEPLKAFFDGQGLKTAWADVPHQGKTLHVSDISGVPLEFCATMTVVPRPLTQFHLHKGGSALRLDHYQILVPDVRQGLRVLHVGGLLAHRIPVAGQQRRIRRRLPRAQGQPARHRVLQGEGPAPAPRRVHGAGDLPHHARLRLSPARSASARASSAGPAGTGRGMRSMSICAIPTDTGSRSSTPTIRRWTSKCRRCAGTPPIRFRVNPWGLPAQKKWYQEATPFAGVDLNEPAVRPNPVTLERYLAERRRLTRCGNATNGGHG